MPLTDLVQQLLLRCGDGFGAAACDFCCGFGLANGLFGLLLQEVAIGDGTCEACGDLVSDAVARERDVLLRERGLRFMRTRTTLAMLGEAAGDLLFEGARFVFREGGRRQRLQRERAGGAQGVSLS